MNRINQTFPFLSCRGLRLLMGALVVLGFASSLYAEAPAPPKPQKENAKSVILIWLGGGPSQTDTFDPKPNAGFNFAGPLNKALPTNVKGVEVSQYFPLLAQHADKYALIRGFTHGDFGHETASFKMLTGTPGTGDITYPLVGCVVAYKLHERGYNSTLPAFICLGGHFTRVGGAGFLGKRYEAYVARVENNTSSPGVQKSLDERKTLFQTVDASVAAKVKAPDFDATRATAVNLMSGEDRKVFDISEEPKEIQERYNTKHHLGQNCLLARRLVAKGVPFVSVSYDGWDSHTKNFEHLEKRMCPPLDKALTALLTDLHEKNLLKTTIVVVFGEFGRTPEIYNEPPWFGGRHHWGHAMSVFLAGGGFKGGQIVGETDGVGGYVVRRPVYPWDLWGSIYQRMGIEPTARLPHPEGRVVRVTPPPNENTPGGDLLTEIMENN